MTDDFETWLKNRVISEDSTSQIAREAYERGLNDGKLAQIMPGEVINLPPRVALSSAMYQPTPIRIADPSASALLASRPGSSMTVRESFAMAAMQGMLAGGSYERGESMNTTVGFADRLIAALESKS